LRDDLTGSFCRLRYPGHRSQHGRHQIATGDTLGFAWRGDYDRDGDQDLYVTNDGANFRSETMVGLTNVTAPPLTTLTTEDRLPGTTTTMGISICTCQLPHGEQTLPEQRGAGFTT
jgi:hypothetical protein